MESLKLERLLLEAQLARRARIQGEMERSLFKEDILWRQKYGVFWKKEDDCNTRFFHNVSNIRYKKINHGVGDEEGEYWVNSKTILEEDLYCFGFLFTKLLGEL